MKQRKFAHLKKLMIQSLRSDKVITLLLVLLPFLTAYGVSVSNISLLSNGDSLQNYIVQNQGNLLLGKITGNTIESASVWRVRFSVAILISILNAVLMVRATRREEDLGRLELVRSGAVGRFAPLMAVLIKVFLANFLGGIGMTVAFLSVSFPFMGSLAAGMSTALCACAIAVISAVFAQISPNARIARGLSFGIIAVFMVLCMAANGVGSYSMLLLTPLGWCAYTRPFGSENWLLFLFAIPIIIILFLFAFVLLEKRDIGSGYLRERKGRERGKKYLNSPFGLAFRLLRSTLFTWIAAYSVIGVIIGSLMPNINKMLLNVPFAPELSESLGGSGKAFLAVLSYILTQIITSYSIIIIMRCYEEESRNRTELVLSGPVSRMKYMISYLIVAYLGSGGAVLLFGYFSGDIISSVVRIPAIWMITSLAVFLLGIAPRILAFVSWGIFGILLAIEFMWEMRIVGDSVFKISPFSWIYPGSKVSVFTILIMLILSVILIAAGIIGYSKRDILS